jgi:hypothetical protein
MDSLLRFQLVAEFEVSQNLFDGCIQSLTTSKPELAQQGPPLRLEAFSLLVSKDKS